MENEPSSPFLDLWHLAMITGALVMTGGCNWNLYHSQYSNRLDKRLQGQIQLHQRKGDKKL